VVVFTTGTRGEVPGKKEKLWQETVIIIIIIILIVFIVPSGTQAVYEFLPFYPVSVNRCQLPPAPFPSFF
jgi:uncharacterized integral membrane protein